jgi:hypothetical protein
VNELVSALLLTGGVVMAAFVLPFALAWLEGPPRTSGDAVRSNRPPAPRRVAARHRPERD